MASGLPSVAVLALCVILAPSVSGGSQCESYTDMYNIYHPSKTCWFGFCCGDCYNRYCCQETHKRFSEDQQEDCVFNHFPGSPLPMIIGFGSLATIILIIFCCCICPCCCLYKMCRKPRPVVATTTHTTVVTTAGQQYPQQPISTPGQPQAYQYPPYQPVPVQPGYAVQPQSQGYGTQPMPTSPYHGQPFTAGPPPTYQEATGPGYPPNPMPYSQAAFTPGQPAYPLQPPAMPQPSGPPAQTDFLAQPAYNPDYVAPPPRTG